MALTACDKDQEFTPAMPEAKLINGITFKVSENLPLAIGMDSTIVFAIDAPEELEDRSIIWKSTDETVAKVSQQGTITGIAEGTAIELIGEQLEVCSSLPIVAIGNLVFRIQVETGM